MPIILCIVFFVSLVTPATAQAPLDPFTLPLYSGRTLANNPFAPFIRIFPALESGKLILELRNDFYEPVRLEDAFLKEGDASKSLLEDQRELYPAERVLIDITEELEDLFRQGVSEPQEKIVGISLSLDPVPNDQPEPSEYRVTFEDGQLTNFTKIENF